MFGELQICEFDDLTTLEKSVAVVRLYINNVLQGTGTIKEIADKLGRSTNSIYQGIHKTRHGLSRRTHYRVELVEWVEYPKTQYEVFWKYKNTGEMKLIAKGSIQDLSLETGYNEQYLRILASPVASKNLKAQNKGLRNWTKELVVRRVGK